MYVVVAAGFAVTLAPVVALKPVAGDQVYVLAPLAVSDVEFPSQMEGAEGETETAGEGFTVTVTVAVLVHPELVPETV